MKDRKHSASWIRNQSEGVKRAWREGKYPRKQTPMIIEARIAPLRGRKQSPSAIENRAVKLRGRRLNEAHRLKAIANLTRNGKPNLVATLTKEQEARRRLSIARALTGTHGFGRHAADNPLHCKARGWTLRDPKGNTHNFTNLLSWARKHEAELFEDDGRSKYPKWHRFARGIASLQRTDGKAAHHYKGWTLVSVWELPLPFDFHRQRLATK